MRQEPHPCMVLHQRPFKESSLLVELFSSLHGRVGAVAKGARQGKSAKLRQLQAFRPLSIGWSGRSELKNLTHAEASGADITLTGPKLISGFYLNELLVRLLPRDDAHPELYDAYISALTGLRDAIQPERNLRIFEKRLLTALGYGLVLDHDIGTGLPIEPDRSYYVQADRGPLLSGANMQDHIRVGGEILLQLHAETLDSAEVLAEAKRLMRFLLKHQLGGRALNSRMLFRSYHRH
jgi:DNA repair protein RecO (recombination protein O)